MIKKEPLTIRLDRGWGFIGLLFIILALYGVGFIHGSIRQIDDAICYEWCK
jgi:hypothetical protein